ncbi:hypothetical protein RO3G_08980 [Rhizopus delemar RA 99-880]|uniref:Uncharacterized protein n=1 Tax=Rhizopus delemar (strain RA 99-880 / ATCC MYA-4621 / FGSC 9543 / NRRL 43880) TaxID=246409 RepID=I1C740_RHIO9|nr:hypothetical protein RO3G_08980 [Rhizopus delemar RA 99-880]|eukprot:EIE84270.1 hypothetical protein RO3G_08980 [Rhizopus delemar RA 99-880]
MADSPSCNKARTVRDFQRVSGKQGFEHVYIS